MLEAFNHLITLGTACLVLAALFYFNPYAAGKFFLGKDLNETERKNLVLFWRYLSICSVLIVFMSFINLFAED